MCEGDGMEEWKEYKLEEICTKITDGSHFSPQACQTGYPMFSVKDMHEYGFDYSNCKHISAKDFESMKNGDCVPQKGDILVAKDGSFLKQIFECKETKEEAILSSIAMFRPNQDFITPTFLCYLLKSPKVYNYIASNCVSGSALPRIVLKDFKKVSIQVPPLPTQQKIAAILSSLDDKIELNNKINTNLEQQAGALFKNWFVDFEPFGGKMPEGWKEIALEELCTVVTKGTTPTTLGKKFTETGINFIKGESILENHTFDIQKISHIDEETNTMLKRSIIEPNDILFTIAGTLGRFAMIDKSLTPANTNQAVGIIRENPEIVSPYYLYNFFIGNWHNDYYTKRIQQAVQANLSLGTIKSLPIIIPDSQNLNKYTSLIEPLFKQMKQLENENIKLSTLRDTLLPKLMNGEIEM